MPGSCCRLCAAAHPRRIILTRLCVCQCLHLRKECLSAVQTVSQPAVHQRSMCNCARSRRIQSVHALFDAYAWRTTALRDRLVQQGTSVSRLY